MAQEVVTIKLYDIELRIYGNYIKEEYETNSPEEFEIQEIHHENENIYNIIDPNDIEKIEQLAIEQLK